MAVPSGTGIHCVTGVNLAVEKTKSRKLSPLLENKIFTKWHSSQIDGLYEGSTHLKWARKVVRHFHLGCLLPKLASLAQRDPIPDRR